MDPVKHKTATPHTPGQNVLLMAEDDVIGSTQDQDILPNDPKDERCDLMGPSVLNNMEISMIHVLSVEFQPTSSEKRLLDGDVIAEETPQIDFVAT